jgi:protein TonB
MRKPAEFTLFGGLAIGLHLLLLADWPDRGAEVGGMRGAALVSLAGATPQIETMVATWTRPPETAQRIETAQPRTERLVTPAPPIPARIDPAPNARLGLAAMQPPEADAPAPPSLPPKVEMQPPDPVPEPTPKLRPGAKPAKRKQQASAGVALQTSAGSGGSVQAGNREQARTATLSKGKQADLVSAWGARIRSRIEGRKRYPSGTRASGSVTLKQNVDRNGRLQGVSVRKSSGDAKLDGAAVAAARRAGRFPSAPKALTGPAFTFSLAIRFDR